MATHVLSAIDVFPAGTSVGAYEIDDVPPNLQGAPRGAAINTQSMGSSSLTFTGLTDERQYFAAGYVSGKWFYVGFTTTSYEPSRHLTGDQSAALYEATSPSATNRYLTASDDLALSTDERAALDAATSPSGSNAFVTTYDAEKVFDIRAYGAVGDNVTDDRLAITSAIDAAYDAGGGVVVLPEGDWYLRSREDATNRLAFVMKPGVAIIGAGSARTRLRLSNATNAAFVGCSSDLGTAKTVTVNIAVGDSQFTVDSTTGLAAGDPVAVQFGEDPTDSAQSLYAAIAHVVSVDSSTLVTLDIKSEVAVTVASTVALSKTITPFDALLDRPLIGGFSMISDGSVQNAEYGVRSNWTRGAHWFDLYGEHVGAGLVGGGFNFDATGDNLNVGKCVAQSAQASKGRCFNFWNSRNIEIRGAGAERFEGHFVFAEFHCRNIVFKGVRINNNAATRNTATIFSATKYSELIVEDVHYTGRTSAVVWSDAGGSTAYMRFRNVSFDCDPTLFKTLATWQLSGLLRYINSSGTNLVFDCDRREEHTIVVPLTDSGSTNYYLPDGFFTEWSIYVSPSVVTGSGNASGLDVYVGRTGSNGATTTFTAGSQVTSQRGIGTDYPRDLEYTKAAKILVNTGTGHNGNGRVVVFRGQFIRPVAGTTSASEPGSEQLERFTQQRDLRLVRNDQDNTLLEGVDFALGTATGTKIGTATTQKLGFYNSTPIVKPTVTGAHASNAALQSLLTELANLGLIVNNSS